MSITRQQRLKLTGWMIPLAYATGAMAVGITFPRLEHRWLPELVSTMSAPSAMAVCSAIASGMLALTGVVFSLTFVMIQFSATAYSPRLVLWVARDPVMSHALGVFTATFLYALMVLAWVDRGSSGRVPLISGWLTLGLLLASMGLFIALVERIGSLQVNRMLIFTGDQGRTAIADMYPPPGTELPPSPGLEHRSRPMTQTLSHAGRPQVMQSIDASRLVRIAEAHQAVIEVTVAAGDTVLDMSPLMRVYGAPRPLDETGLRQALTTGDERTFDQDPKYALRIMVDIAIKALSPAINDPTTAVQALDQIEDLLIQLGRRRLDIGAHRDQQGALRVLVPVPVWEDFLRLALDEIRAYGADSVQVMRRMKALIKNLHTVLPPERQPALHHWEHRLHGSIARSFEDDEEKRDAAVADRQGLGIGQDKAPAA